MKYLVNIIDHLKEDKYRTINAANKVFIEKVSIANGILDLLQSIGFKVNYKNLNKTHQSVFGRTDSQTEDNNRVIESLKLPHASDDQERLVEIFRQLESAAQTLNIPIQDRPILLQPTKEIELDVARNPIVPFDPMKPQIHRNAAQPLRSGKSTTEEKLEMLQKRRRELEGDIESVTRSTQVLFPKLDGSIAEMSLSSSMMVVNEGFKGNDVDIDAEDKGKIMKAMGKKLGTKPEDAPLTTKAIRDLEKAQKSEILLD